MTIPVQPFARLQQNVHTCWRWVWHHIPVAPKRKQQFKNLLFSRIPILFGGTVAYRRWRSVSGPHVNGATTNIPSTVNPWTGGVGEFVPLLHGTALIGSSAKVISFYLPQFHPIPENDAWWGKGFTEWTNVRTAEPQFAGHYQPRIPGDLGYYNLQDVEVQRRQIALAKLYGIHGFCFYYYWFDGHRLLEAPIESYLRNPDLDLPFCLCWANENWTRRWDGDDRDVLIGQRHSPEDDVAFIADVARHMRDPRYLCVDGRPILLVYRPDLLPSAKDTARRWRNWCRDNGVGEIYLVSTQSFDKSDPAKFGLDATVEFPPNNSMPPDISHRVTPVNDTCVCTVYDWRVFVERSRAYKTPRYKLFRGVCPSWDNTARRKSGGTVFLGNSPQGYQEWLLNAVVETSRRFENPDERLVFVNAWNEWAEGAYLEPDQRHGYAYLEATRQALVRSDILLNKAPIDKSKPVAVVVHAFHDDIFREIVACLSLIEAGLITIYVTCPPEMEAIFRDQLARAGHVCHTHPVVNQGRDILPFLRILPVVTSNGHDVLLKVHTKRSSHRKDGHVWRREVFDQLLTSSALHSAIEEFSKDSGMGILGPDNHVISLQRYVGANQVRVGHLAERLGIAMERLDEFDFVAGSMFFARASALIPLLNIALADDDFEEECGQVDGTMAHVIERVIPISAYAAGLATRSLSGKKVVGTYQFADQSKRGQPACP